MPSRTTVSWKEQFGRVLMEAMLCGTPVAGSDFGAIPVVVGNPEMIFPESNPTAMARTIELACLKGTVPEALAERVRNGSSTDFTHAWITLAASLRKQP